MANGVSRLILAKARLENMSDAERIRAVENENEVAKGIKKMPSKSAVEHNHSSDSFRTKK